MDRPTAAALLSHSLLREVFDRVVDSRTIKFKDIAPPETRKEVSLALQQLTSAGLIQERVAPIEDFNTYFVTARGLGAHRELRHFENRLAQL